MSREIIKCSISGLPCASLAITNEDQEIESASIRGKQRSGSNCHETVINNVSITTQYVWRQKPRAGSMPLGEIFALLFSLTKAALAYLEARDSQWERGPFVSRGVEALRASQSMFVRQSVKV